MTNKDVKRRMYLFEKIAIRNAYSEDEELKPLSRKTLKADLREYKALNKKFKRG